MIGREDDDDAHTSYALKCRYPPHRGPSGRRSMRCDLRWGRIEGFIVEGDAAAASRNELGERHRWIYRRIPRVGGEQR